VEEVLEIRRWKKKCCRPTLPKIAGLYTIRGEQSSHLNFLYVAIRASKDRVEPASRRDSLTLFLV
jgi:hypothetical protein